jgi:serine/threonine-protein kinase HipA
MVKWLFFNLMVGNNDSHAKNLSMLSINGKLRLAPFFDLMCTKVYTGLSTNLAFKIGQHFEPEQINYQDVCELTDSIGINRRTMLKIAFDMADQIEKNMPSVVEGLLPLTIKGSSEQILLGRASMTIYSNIKKIRARFESPGGVNKP